MAKHVTYLPPPPAAASPAPRLAVQLFVALGEMAAIVLLAIGVVTVVTWTLDGFDARHRIAERHRPQPPLICAVDRRGVEWCRRPDDRSQYRRRLVRD